MRLLLKLSGEQLAGDSPRGFDVERAQWIANEIKKMLPKTEVVIIVGAGNFVRGNFFRDSTNIRPVTADNMGMLGTIINAIALADVFNSEGLATAALSNVETNQVIDQYTYRRALSHLAKQRVVIIGGGTGRPFFTTDTSALNLAIELDCDIVAKATKVDGVFDTDPEKNPDAKKLESVSFDRAVEDDAIRVMDKAALALAADHQKPIVVFELLKEGNIAKLARGESVGTKIGQ
jgi:uridylate kinase